MTIMTKTLLMPVGALPFAAALIAAPAMAQGDSVFIGTSMFGEYETDGEGAGEDAVGDFSAELDMKAGQMCYMLEVEGLDTVTAAHVHRGKLGEDGPPVVTLELMGDDGDDVCVEVEPDLLKDIANNRPGYYINVHTEEFPSGAIRGQLGVE